AIKSVISQTTLPKKWVIVSDGSTDCTEGIVSRRATQHDFIQLVRLAKKEQRAFSSQAHAANVGYEQVRDMEFDFVGFLDADISLDTDYYEKVLAKFKENPRLGIAGGFLLENHHGRFKSRFGNSEKCVAGAVQLFRRECYEDIG